MRVRQFLQVIMQAKLLYFSVESRRYVWNLDMINKQMISDEVAELMARTLSQLPKPLMKTLQIVSCLGSQVEASTLELLNSGQEILSFDMQDQLCLAAKESRAFL